MSWFGRKVTITVIGANAQEAHTLMHEFNIEHHAFHDFNGLNLTEVGGMIYEQGSNKVCIPLHGKGAKNPEAVVSILSERNPSWRVIAKR